MAQNQSEWLREQLAGQSSGAAGLDPDDQILNFRRFSERPGRREPDAAIELVHQAAAVIKGIEDRASKIEGRAEDLVKRAIDKLHIAEARIQAAEIDRRAAE